MGARVAPVAAPVVVVNAGAVGGEVLGEQHVLEVVAARRVARNRGVDPLAGHRFVRYPPQDVVDARRRTVGNRPLEGQRRPDWRTIFECGQHCRVFQIGFEVTAWGVVPIGRDRGVRQSGQANDCVVNVA